MDENEDLHDLEPPTHPRQRTHDILNRPRRWKEFVDITFNVIKNRFKQSRTAAVAQYPAGTAYSLAGIMIVNR